MWLVGDIYIILPLQPHVDSYYYFINVLVLKDFLNEYLSELPE